MLNHSTYARQWSNTQQDSQSIDATTNASLLVESKQNEPCSTQTPKYPTKSSSRRFRIYKLSKISDAELKSEMGTMSFDDDVFANDDPMKPEKQQGLSFRTYKNLVVISIAFLLQFTAFNGMGNLQSSLNTEANVGVNSLSILYGFLIFSSIFLPHPMMAIFGLKWTIIICQIA